MAGRTHVVTVTKQGDFHHARCSTCGKVSPNTTEAKAKAWKTKHVRDSK